MLELMLPWRVHIYILYRVIYTAKGTVEGVADPAASKVALVQTCVYANIFLLRALRGHTAATKRGDPQLMLSRRCSEQVTMKVTALDTFLSELQESDYIMDQLLILKMQDDRHARSLSISKVLLNNSVMKSQWHTLFTVRLFHAVRFRPSKEQTSPLLLLLLV